MNDEELLRYSRHILLPEIGIEGQEKLRAAHVLVIGAGGLGSPVALYLASAGVGRITICDGDDVDLTNLQRQIMHRTEAVGRSGWVHVKALREQARGLIGRFNVKAGGPDAAAKSLSGGNLQKYIVGREIDAKPRLLVISQPTWGVDVGAAAQIRGELLQLRDAGCAVLVVSEELDELFEISDRLHVIAKGRISPPIERAAATVTQIGEWMSGSWDKPAGAAGSAKKEEGAHA